MGFRGCTRTALEGRWLAAFGSEAHLMGSDFDPTLAADVWAMWVLPHCCCSCSCYHLHQMQCHCCHATACCRKQGLLPASAATGSAGCLGRCWCSSKMPPLGLGQHESFCVGP